MKTFILILFFSFVNVSPSLAEEMSSFEIHDTKLEASVKNCPQKEIVIAKEVLELELAGMRYLKSKPSCFENLKMKYVHTSKNPDEADDSLVRVVDGSGKILTVAYDKKFFSYKAVFSVKTKAGATVKDSFSFMTSTKPGAKKPNRGCAIISASPSKAFVKDSCL